MIHDARRPTPTNAPRTWTLIPTASTIFTLALLLAASACGRRSETTSSEQPVRVEGRDTAGAPNASDPAATTNDAADTTHPVAGSDFIRVTSPRPGETITSPLVVTGEARGPWYFEASFPVRLLDESGRDLAIATAQAQGEWTTDRFVPFTARLSFAPPRGNAGMLVLEKSNPSGRPERASEVRVSVRFK